MFFSSRCSFVVPGIGTIHDFCANNHARCRTGWTAGLLVPYGKEGVLADIRNNVHMLSESYGEKGVCLKVKANLGTLTALKQRLAS